MAAKTIKISDETLALLGATEADFESKLAAMLKDNGKLTADLAAFADFKAEVTSKLTAIDQKIVALEARKPELAAADKTNIIDLAKEAAKTEAKATASSEVAAVISKAGVQSIAGGGVGAGNEKPDFKALVKAKMAADAKLTKAQAIEACVNAHPEAYAEWKKTGGDL